MTKTGHRRTARTVKILFPRRVGNIASSAGNGDGWGDLAMAREIMCHLDESPIMAKYGHLNEYARKTYLIVTGEPGKINQKLSTAPNSYKHFAIE